MTPYEGYASDVVISRDERFGGDDWHQRAVDAYYTQASPLLGTMRAEIPAQTQPVCDHTQQLALRTQPLKEMDEL